MAWGNLDRANTPSMDLGEASRNLEQLRGSRSQDIKRRAPVKYEVILNKSRKRREKRTKSCPVERKNTLRQKKSK